MRNGLLIGLGTGRCGTTSLACLLNSGRGCSVTHEQIDIRVGLSWEFNQKGAKKALDILDGRSCDRAGDVAFYYLPYVEWISKARPGSTFVCLKRDRKETIDSYMKKCGPRDHWSRFKTNRDSWDRMYPRFDTFDKKKAIGMYWDFYYAEAERLEKSGVDIKTFDMRSMNNEDGVKKILDFCGLDCDHAPVGVKKNSL
jgi:hypothetical protein